MRKSISTPFILSVIFITLILTVSKTFAAGQPTVTIAATNATATIGSATGTATLTFTRTGSTAAALAVNYALGGSAVKWDDYRTTNGDMPVSVTIPAGAASTTMTIVAEGNETNANPETATFTLSPAAAYTVGAQNSVTITIMPAAPVLPTVTIAVNNATATIGSASGTATLTFTRTGSTAATLAVNYALGGSAVKWDDYRTTNGDMPVSVTIPAGAASTTMTIVAEGNETNANPETATFTLSPAAAYTVGAQNSVTITIMPAAPVLPTVTIAVNNATATIGSATGTATLTFTRTGSTAAALAVNYALGGSAITLADYRTTNGDMPVSMTIPAGAASTTMTIVAEGNETNANPETATFTLSPAAAYTVGAQNSVTITIMPAAPVLPTVTIAVSNATATIGSATGTATLTFTRTGSTAAALAVNYALGGSAITLDDYRTTNGDMPVSVTIPAGAASTTMTIVAEGNETNANPETATFTLSPAAAYTVGAQNSVTVTIMPAAPVLPTVTIAVSNATATIGSATGTATLTFTRTGSTAAALAVNYALGGSAITLDDYRTTNGDMPVSVTIPAGAASTTMTIVAEGNETNANPETATFTLSPAAAYTVGAQNSVTVTILANSSTGTGGTDPANRTTDPTTAGDYVDDTDLQLPKVGSNLLHILSPSLIELVSINTKQPDPAQVVNWNFINSSGQATKPAAGKFTVTVAGQTVQVQSVGFKRRVLYAPLQTYDLRIENCLYLQIATPIANQQLVTVTNPDGTLWSSSIQYTALCDPQRYSPAIHVNQEGYVPQFSKQAMVGYYLGDMGEMPINASAGFNVIDADTGAVVYSGTLTPRPDTGYDTTPAPYQNVYVADFSSFTTPGEYQVQVPGMGASLPFLIDDGIAMAWTRTYALGLYEQRSGMAVSMPYTRFTHAADHTAPALVPVPDTSSQFAFTWNCITGYATTVNTDNAPQIAPFLTSNETSLYPFVKTGTVNVSGGHFDAGDYSKYTENSAQLVHELIFAVDNIPGLQHFDNLGIPESGDSIPDVLQEAKWEADFLAKMQDSDGGFYFLVYPIDREYESNVLPENGDQQVVWPKNTSVTAASVAALAEAGSSPMMKKYYPQAAANYLQEAQLGWQFLMNAIAKYGRAGAYQKITFYSDDWTDNDEEAWAAAALYTATGNSQYQTQLFQWLPNPADSSTFRWGWWQMAEGWGNAIRDYAFAVQSGRLPASALNASYLALCDAQVVAAGDDAVTWGNNCAYGTPFPPATKAVLGGGWYFSLDQASDMAVAYQINPKPAYITGLVAAMNYEGGCNPVNVCYLEGLGLKRQQQTVSQYAQNSRRMLSPTGDTIGQVTAGFEYLNSYGSELSELSYPTDSGATNSYPYYDRWSDAYNVTTEQITVNQARSLISVGLLASLTNSASTAWTAPQATITVPTTTVPLNAPVTLSVQVPGQNLTNTRIVWEARDQQPAFGLTYTISPVNNGDQWVEVEVEWPDGRRAFAAGDFQANSPSQVWIDDALPANAVTTAEGGDSWNWISSNPSPHTGGLAFQSAIASGEHDLSFTGTTGSMDDDASTIGLQGSMQVGSGDTLFAWVYIDPANPPTEIMLSWYDGSSWAHRAYWGADSIPWGTNGTASQLYVGPLPAAGQWIQLSVPASAVGLQGDTVSGMDFAAVGGRVAWDTIGRAAAGN